MTKRFLFILCLFISISYALANKSENISVNKYLYGDTSFFNTSQLNAIESNLEMISNQTNIKIFLVVVSDKYKSESAASVVNAYEPLLDEHPQSIIFLYDIKSHYIGCCSFGRGIPKDTGNLFREETHKFYLGKFSGSYQVQLNNMLKLFRNDYAKYIAKEEGVDVDPDGQATKNVSFNNQNLPKSNVPNNHKNSNSQQKNDTQNQFHTQANKSLTDRKNHNDTNTKTQPVSLRRYVTDNANMLSTEVANSLNEELAKYDKNTTNQIVVLTEPALPKYTSLNMYANQLFNKNGIGQKNKDKGILILLIRDSHDIRIEVGRGLESIITDAISSQIIRVIMVPLFKSGNFNLGVSSAVGYIEERLNGENVTVSKWVNQNLSGVTKSSSEKNDRKIESPKSIIPSRLIPIEPNDKNYNRLEFEFIRDSAKVLSREAFSKIYRELAIFYRDFGKKIVLELENISLLNTSIEAQAAKQFIYNFAIQDGYAKQSILILIIPNKNKGYIEYGSSIKKLFSDGLQEKLLNTILNPAINSDNFEKGVTDVIAKLRLQFTNETNKQETDLFQDNKTLVLLIILIIVSLIASIIAAVFLARKLSPALTNDIAEISPQKQASIFLKASAIPFGLVIIFWVIGIVILTPDSLYGFNIFMGILILSILTAIIIIAGYKRMESDSPETMLTDDLKSNISTLRKQQNKIKTALEKFDKYVSFSHCIYSRQLEEAKKLLANFSSYQYKALENHIYLNLKKEVLVSNDESFYSIIYSIGKERAAKNFDKIFMPDKINNFQYNLQSRTFNTGKNANKDPMIIEGPYYDLILISSNGNEFPKIIAYQAFVKRKSDAPPFLRKKNESLFGSATQYEYLPNEDKNYEIQIISKEVIDNNLLVSKLILDITVLTKIVLGLNFSGEHDKVRTWSNSSSKQQIYTPPSSSSSSFSGGGGSSGGGGASGKW